MASTLSPFQKSRKLLHILSFSVILAMLKYCHILEGQQEGLLFDAYICNKELHFSKINTWYSSILYIIDESQISLP
jgi:hypothetical protein